jgi:DNA-binding GntR family transcriptional regulator
VKRRHAASRVELLEDALERQVLDGRFKPGEHLVETALADEFNVGRNTLRAAFDGLVRRGLLVKARNRGVFVRALTAHDLSEIYQLRTALEVQASRILATTRVIPDGAKLASEIHRQVGAGSPPRVIVEADLAFHRALVVATGNTRLMTAHKNLETEILICLTQLIQGYATVGQLAHEHSELLDAIESGEADAAETLIRHHLEGAAAWLVDHVTPPADGADYPVEEGAAAASSDLG